MTWSSFRCSRTQRVVAGGCFWLLLFTAAAQAQSWPQRTVRFIVPLGPGSATDISARLVAERLQQRWGQPVVIENRPGGDGFVAITTFLGANDDHTLLYAGMGTFTAHPYLHEKLPYNRDDIVPVAGVSNIVVAVAVPAFAEGNSLAELVSLARAQPGKLNAAAVPGITDFITSAFLKTAGIDMARVPYRDINQSFGDLGEGRIQVALLSLSMVQPQVQAGKARLLAVTSRNRVPTLPEVPTVSEAGYPVLELEGLVGLYGPRDHAARTARADRQRHPGSCRSRHGGEARDHRPGPQRDDARRICRRDRGPACQSRRGRADHRHQGEPLALTPEK